MDHVPDVIYFKDKKGRLVLVNRAHAKGLGAKPEDVVGKTDFDFFSKKRSQEMAKDDLYIIRTGKPIIDKVERATRPDGIDNYVSTTKIPMSDEKGRVIGLIGITRDITRRMQFERLKKEKVRIEKKLEVLEVQFNQLKAIPEEITNLKNLKKLHITNYGKEQTKIPESIKSFIDSLESFSFCGKYVYH